MAEQNAEIQPETVQTEQPLSGGLNVSADPSAEEQVAKMQKEQDLRKLDDEIRMLRQVLRDKVEQARVLRTDLGLATPLDAVENVTKDLEKGINQFATDIGETEAFKKTQGVVGDIGRTTVSGLSAFGGLLGAKFQEVKNSESVGNISQKVGNVGSSLLDTVANLTKPQPKDFNDGNS